MAVGGFIKAGAIADRTANPVEGQIYFALDTGAEGAARYNGQEWEELYTSPAGGGAHDHDTDYAPLVHNHDAAYSPLGHNHDGAYAPLVHNHDAAYSAIGHNHDDVYPRLGSTNTYTASGQNFVGLNVLGATENAGTWARGLFFTDLSGDSSTRRGGLGVYGTAAATQRLWLTLADSVSPWNSVYGIHMLPLGLVGIGTTTPSVRLHIAAGGILSSGTAPAGTSLFAVAGATSAQAEPIRLEYTVNDAPSGTRGLMVEPDIYPVAGAATMYNVLSIPKVRGANNLATMMAGYFRVDLESYTGTVATTYGLYVGNPTLIGGTGAITTNYGIYIATPTTGGVNYALYVAGGQSRFYGDVLFYGTNNFVGSTFFGGGISVSTVLHEITHPTNNTAFPYSNVWVTGGGVTAAGYGAERTMQLKSAGASSPYAFRERVRWIDTTDTSEDSELSLWVAKAGTLTEVARLDGQDNASNTGLVLMLNGVLKRVGAGAADSGGAGYKLLRVPN